MGRVGPDLRTARVGSSNRANKGRETAMLTLRIS
jgi:hypothetical protein